MISKQQMNKLLIFGAVAGLITTLLMKGIRYVLDMLGQFTPEIHAKLASGAAPVISINVRESLTGINAGLSGWLADALGLTVPSNMWMPYVMGAAGGAILIVAGAYAADMLGVLSGDAAKKTAMTIFLGSAIAAFVIGGFAVPALGISFANSAIAFGINAAILAYAYVAIDKQLKLGLIPF